MIVNKSALADFIGVHHSTIDGMIHKGMPVKKRGTQGTSWEFDTAQIVRWLKTEERSKALGQTYNLDAEQLRIRKLAAETAIVEIEADKAKGLVVEVEQIERHLINEYTAIRTRMLAVSRRVATRIVGETDERRIKQEINDEIREALESLSEYEPVITTDNNESEKNTKAAGDIDP